MPHTSVWIHDSVFTPLVAPAVPLHCSFIFGFPPPSARLWDRLPFLLSLHQMGSEILPCRDLPPDRSVLVELRCLAAAVVISASQMCASSQLSEFAWCQLSASRTSSAIRILPSPVSCLSSTCLQDTLKSFFTSLGIN